jgi:hypothetical protein
MALGEAPVRIRAVVAVRSHGAKGEVNDSSFYPFNKRNLGY